MLGMPRLAGAGLALVLSALPSLADADPDKAPAPEHDPQPQAVTAPGPDSAPKPAGSGPGCPGPDAAARPDADPPLYSVFNPGFFTAGSRPAANPSLAGTAKLDPGLLCSLQAMGAKNSIPDGVGLWCYPAQPVSGQHTSFGFTQGQLGVTAPLWSSSSEVVFGNFTVGHLGATGSALLGNSLQPVPTTLWDIEGGLAYVKQVNPTWSWGLMLGGGSVSDKPFAALRDDTVSGAAFVRKRQSDQTAWLFYVVSTTHGQVGQNIPVPGVAYEFVAPRCKGLVGFPFLELKYKLTDQLYLGAYYCALTDTQVRMNYQPVKGLLFYQDFTWAYQAWLPHERPEPHLMLFSYEKRLETGVNWLFAQHMSLNVAGGFAFDRYFVENAGFALHGPNEANLGSTPYLAAQLLLQY